MANEVNISAAWQVNKNGVTSQSSGTASLTAAGNGRASLTQSIATSATQLNLGTITSVPGAVYIKNLDATNYVEIDANTSFNGFPQKLLPGQIILLAPETATIYGKAHTGAVLVEIGASDS